MSDITKKTHAHDDERPLAEQTPPDAARPQWPSKAVVTAGMPYGNKGLHFGHIGGVFVPADVFARFLRDRIGEQNVLFISGTDCYGSPIDEGYRKLVETGDLNGSIADFVESNHKAQATTLKSYDISLDIFEGSGLGISKQVHEQMTVDLLTRLHVGGYLSAIETAQFYDEKAQTFLNGRQVVGYCPVQGCKSEHAYADECDLGHQYMPEDLIAPKSSITGDTPLMRNVSNWYFELPTFREVLKGYVAERESAGATRPVVLKTIEEFLGAPIIYVKNEHQELYEKLRPTLPSHTFRPAEKGKASFELEFEHFSEREQARDALVAAGARLRTGKTLVPFRITGNIAWGVPAPRFGAASKSSAESDETSDKLTVWCWPESLWAPISFTKARLTAGAERVESLNPERPDAKNDSWESYWCDPKARVYQFIGQDNIYFYGVAQTALWSALAAGSNVGSSDKAGGNVLVDPSAGEIQQTQLIANYHLQFLGKKASSSGAIRPPMADELLDYYTPEQLRAHFLALGLGQKPVSFQPKPLNPEAAANEGDPVLKEGVLLTNVLNRLARSCFYAAHNDNEGKMPLVTPSEELVSEVRKTLEAYENLMFKQEFHGIMHLADTFIRFANKYWADSSKASVDDPKMRRSVLGNAFYLLRAACLMMHPVAPTGTRMVFEYLELDTDERSFFSWEHAFEGYEPFISEADRAKGEHAVKELPPRTDFFAKHPSQFE